MDLSFGFIGDIVDILEFGKCLSGAVDFLSLREILEGVETVDHIIVRLFKNAVILNELLEEGFRVLATST